MTSTRCPECVAEVVTRLSTDSVLWEKMPDERTWRRELWGFARLVYTPLWGNLAIQMKSFLNFFAYSNYESPPLWIHDVLCISLYNWWVWQAPTAPPSGTLPYGARPTDRRKAAEWNWTLLLFCSYVYYVLNNITVFTPVKSVSPGSCFLRFILRDA